MTSRVIALLLILTATAGCDKFRQFLAKETWKWSASGIAETRRRGDVISKAIEAYRARKGEYPAQLSELQPEFLREIPRPTVGYRQWEYMLIDAGKNYSLEVVASEFGQQLSRTAKGWQYMDDHGLRTSNQSLEPTASRRVTSLFMTKTNSLQPPPALASGGSAPSR